MSLFVAAQAVSPWLGIAAHPVLGLLATGLSGLALHQAVSARRLAAALAGRRQDARLSEEFAAYMQIDLSPTFALSDFGRLVSHRISTCSSFARAAILLRNAAGELRVTGSSGMDDLSVQALARWADVAANDPSWSATAPRAAENSFRLTLERRSATADHAADALSCPEVLFLPFGTPANLLGGIVLCVDVRPSSLPVIPTETESGALPLAAILRPLEALAGRLTLQLGALEAAAATRPIRHSSPMPPARRGPRHSKPAPSGPAQSAEVIQRRTLDRTDALGPAAYTAVQIRRLLEQNAPRGVDLPPRAESRMVGFPPARVWKGAGLRTAMPSV